MRQKFRRYRSTATVNSSNCKSEPTVRKTRVCLVTFEMKGIIPGGIGVLTHNLVRSYSQREDIDLAILWYGDKPIDSSVFTLSYPACRLFFTEDLAAANQYDGAAYPPAQAFALDRYLQSAELMRALRRLEREGEVFDVVEFPDFGGAAFATLGEKQLGRAFQRSTIAVRLHSTEAVLRK